MDPFEKKIRELYQQKKLEDEKIIPGFEVFRNELKQVKKVRTSCFFLKIAASVALVVAMALYCFLNLPAPATETAQIHPVNINQSLPTRLLLYKSVSNGYIWNWKAPTDQLLDDAAKSFKTEQ